MPPPLSQQIASRVRDAAQMYHRLVLVVGPARGGKTAAMHELAEEHGWPLVNLNLSLAKRMLELTTRQRALRVPRLCDDVIAEHPGDVLLLDNIEMLFHPDLQQDPLRLLQSLARNRTIAAAWRGHMQNQTLIYAGPKHPEYRRYDAPRILIVTTGKTGIPTSRAQITAREQTP